MARRSAVVLVGLMVLSMAALAPVEGGASPPSDRAGGTAHPSPAGGGESLGVCGEGPIPHDEVRGKPPTHGAAEDQLAGWEPNDSAICDAVWSPGFDPAGADNYEYFVPQGLDLLSDTTALVSGYNDFVDDDNNNGLCELFVIDLTAAPGENQVLDSAVLPFCDHAGGVATDGAGNRWVADTHTLLRVDSALVVQQAITLEEPLRGSFITEDPDGSIWLGRFAEDEPSKMWRFSTADLLAAGTLTVDDSSGTRVIPPDVQGATFSPEGELWTSMSASRWGRIGTGPSWGDACLEFGPGVEEIEFDSQGRLWAAFEAGTVWFNSDSQPFFPVIAAFDPWLLSEPADSEHGDCEDRADCSAGSASDGLVNMGFEDGFTGWTQVEASDGIDITGDDGFTEPWEGSQMARLGLARSGPEAYQPMGRNEICQEFTVDQTLESFAFNIFTYDYTGFDDFDFELRVTDPDTGEVISRIQQGAWGTVGDISLKTSGWRGVTLDLSDHVDEKLEISFSAAGTRDTLYGFWVYLDSASTLPPQPISTPQVSSPEASVMVDPLTGLVTIAVPTPGFSGAAPRSADDLAFETEVACPTGVPESVTLLLAGFGFPMAETAAGSGTWTATVPIADATAGPVSIQATCPGVTYVLTLGQLVFYEPLGTITDAETGDPVEGAAVTLHRVPDWTPMAGPEDVGPTKCQSNESQAGEPWSQPAPTDVGVEEPALSDAMAPSVNPFLANAGGRYGWALTPGCWYVVVEATGYETLTSPVVGIGSQVADLDLELVASEEPPSFPDVPATHQFWADIIWMAQHGITTGYPDGYFRPAAGVTRGSMAAFMARLDDHLDGAGGGARTACPGAGPFPDVGTSHPFCAEIAWMVGKGITTGLPDGNFRPGDGVTRQSMAAFMYRMAGSPDGSDPECAAAPLADVPTSNPMCGEIAWMLAEEVTGGYPDGTYRPGLPVSRQAMSAFMHRFADVIG